MHIQVYSVIILHAENSTGRMAIYICNRRSDTDCVRPNEAIHGCTAVCPDAVHGIFLP